MAFSAVSDFEVRNAPPSLCGSGNLDHVKSQPLMPSLNNDGSAVCPSFVSSSGLKVPYVYLI